MTREVQGWARESALHVAEEVEAAQLRAMAPKQDWAPPSLCALRYDAAEAAEVELGEDLEDGDVEPVEVVQRELADGGAGDDHFYARVGDLLEDLYGPQYLRRTSDHNEKYLLEVLLFTRSEVKHLFLVMDEHGTLRLSLSDVKRASEYRDFRLVDLLNHA